ncbi:MAG: hypothetical protein LAO04_19585 [Acidobacteriia bacterium]|nr:hypothetical protein [Terriglobia bacterium]
MGRYFFISILSGALFAIMDGLIHANPLARRLFAAYGPLAKTSVNVFAGIAIDIFCGFAMAGVFILLYKALPGGVAVAKGVSFGLSVWFFRVVMGVAGEWMTLNVPKEALAYRLVTGLVEMLALGVLYGLTLPAFRLSDMG